MILSTVLGKKMKYVNEIVKEMPGGQVIDICLNGVYKRT